MDPDNISYPEVREMDESIAEPCRGIMGRGRRRRIGLGTKNSFPREGIPSRSDPGIDRDSLFIRKPFSGCHGSAPLSLDPRYYDLKYPNGDMVQAMPIGIRTGKHYERIGLSILFGILSLIILSSDLLFRIDPLHPGTLLVTIYGLGVLSGTYLIVGYRDKMMISIDRDLDHVLDRILSAMKRERLVHEVKRTGRKMVSIPIGGKMNRIDVRGSLNGKRTSVVIRYVKRTTSKGRYLEDLVLQTLDESIG